MKLCDGYFWTITRKRDNLHENQIKHINVKPTHSSLHLKSKTNKQIIKMNKIFVIYSTA